MLVKAAHSANIKERRDCSCALFDADGRDGHAGRAHPRPPRRDAGRGAGDRGEARRAERPWIAQRPLRRRHAPARTSPSSRRSFARRRHAARLRRQPRPPRRRRRTDAGLHAGRLHDARGRGRRYRAAPARRRRHRRARRARCATPPSAAPTCAPSSPPTAPAPPSRELAERVGADELRDADRRGAGLRRAPHARLHRRARRRRRAGRRRARGTRGRPRAAPDGDRRRATSSRSTSPARADQHEGNLNCPLAVTLSACLFAVRVLTDPDIPPSAGASRPLDVIAPEGSLLNARSPAAVVGGQRRDLQPRRRPGARRLRPRARARAR